MTTQQNQTQFRYDTKSIKESFDFEAYLLHTCENPKPSAEGFTFRCPFHDDNVNSLAYNRTDDLWYCHAGCGGGDSIAFVQKMMNVDFKEVAIAMTHNLIDTYPVTAATRVRREEHERTVRKTEHRVADPAVLVTDKKARLIATYLYNNGALLKCRYENDGNKTFSWYHSHKKQWCYGQGGIKPKLYAPKGITKTDVMIVVEGEKDVDTLCELGYCAVTSPNGADATASKWLSEYSTQLSECTVVIINDDDSPKTPNIGMEYADAVAQKLQGIAKNVYRIEPSEISLRKGVKQDVTDILTKQMMPNEEFKERLKFLIEERILQTIREQQEEEYEKEIKEWEKEEKLWQWHKGKMEQPPKPEPPQSTSLVVKQYDKYAEQREKQIEVISEAMKHIEIVTNNEPLNSQARDMILTCIKMGIKGVEYDVGLDVRARQLCKDFDVSYGVFKRSFKRALQEEIARRTGKQALSSSQPSEGNGREIETFQGHTIKIHDDYFIGENGCSIYSTYSQDFVTNSSVVLQVAKWKDVETHDKQSLLWIYRLSSGGMHDHIEMLVDDDVLLDHNKIVPLLNRKGANIVNGNAFIRWMSQQEAFNPQMPEKLSIHRLGWYGDKLLPYEQDDLMEINIGSDIGTAKELLLRAYTESKGRLVDTVDMIDEIIDKHRMAETIIGTMIAGIFAEPVNIQPWLVYLYEESGSGKSQLVGYCGSLIANPLSGKWIFSGNTTRNATFPTLAFLKNLPFCIDDLAKQSGAIQRGGRGASKFSDKQAEMERLMYNMIDAEGGGRQRAARGGADLQRTQSWKTNIILCGETNFQTPNTSGGLLNRSISVRMKPKIELRDQRKWMNTTLNNYNLAMPLILEEYRKLTPQEHHNNIYELREQIEATENTYGKRAAIIAACIYFYELTARALDLKEKVFDRAYLQEIIGYNQVLSEGLRCYTLVCGWVEVNAHHFVHGTDSRNEAWGKFANIRCKKYVCILSKRLEDFVGEYNYSIQTFKTWGLESGMVLPEQQSLIDGIKMKTVPIRYNWDVDSNTQDHIEEYVNNDDDYTNNDDYTSDNNDNNDHDDYTGELDEVF